MGAWKAYGAREGGNTTKSSLIFLHGSAHVALKGLVCILCEATILWHGGLAGVLSSGFFATSRLLPMQVLFTCRLSVCFLLCILTAAGGHLRLPRPCRWAIPGSQ